MAVPNLNVGDTLRLRATAHSNGQTAYWGCGQVVTSITGVGLSVPQLANAIAPIWDPLIAPRLCSLAQVTDPLVELFDPITRKTLQSAYGASGRPMGTAGGLAIPTQVCAVVTKLTGLSGRKQRGRLYWPFLADQQLTAGGLLLAAEAIQFTSTSGTMFGSQTWAVGVDSVTLSAVLFHIGKVVPIPPVTITTLQAFHCSGRLGTQRRRGDYGQPNPIV